MSRTLRRLALALAGALALSTAVAAVPADAADDPFAYGTITGVVRGPDGKPVDDLRVVAFEAGVEDLIGFDDATDAAGRYVIEARPGRYDLQTDDALAERFAKTDVPGLTVRDGATLTVDLTVQQALTLSGRVTRADGGKVAGTEVFASSSDARGSYGHYGTVAADGSYTVRGLHPARWRVSVDPFHATDALLLPEDLDGRVVAVQDGVGSPVDVTADTTLRTVVLDQRTPVVTGVVRGVGGRPVKGLSVHVEDAFWYSQDNEDGTYPGIGDETDAAGRFTLRLAEPGRAKKLKVEAADAGYADQVVATSVPAVGGTRQADVRLRSRAAVTPTVKSSRKKSTVRVVYRPKVAGASRVAKVTVKYTATNGGSRKVRGTLARNGALTVRLTKVKRGTRSVKVHVAGNADAVAVTRNVRARIR